MRQQTLVNRLLKAAPITRLGVLWRYGLALFAGAVLPLAYGALADITSLRSAYVILLVGYGLIGWYGLVGYKKRSW